MVHQRACLCRRDRALGDPEPEGQALVLHRQHADLQPRRHPLQAGPDPGHLRCQEDRGRPESCPGPARARGGDPHGGAADEEPAAHGGNRRAETGRGGPGRLGGEVPQRHRQRRDRHLPHQPGHGDPRPEPPDADLVPRYRRGAKACLPPGLQRPAAGRDLPLVPDGHDPAGRAGSRVRHRDAFGRWRPEFPGRFVPRPGQGRSRHGGHRDGRRHHGAPPGPAGRRRFRGALQDDLRDDGHGHDDRRGGHDHLHGERRVRRRSRVSPRPRSRAGGAGPSSSTKTTWNR